MSIHPLIHPSTLPRIHPLTFHLSILLSSNPSINLSTIYFLFIHSSSMYQSINIYWYPSIHPSTLPSVYPSIIHLSIHLPLIHLPLRQSIIHLSTHTTLSTIHLRIIHLSSTYPSLHPFTWCQRRRKEKRCTQVPVWVPSDIPASFILNL